MHKQYSAFLFSISVQLKKKKGKNSHWTGPPPFLTICKKKKKKFILRLKLRMPSFHLELIFMAEFKRL